VKQIIDLFEINSLVFSQRILSLFIASFGWKIVAWEAPIRVDAIVAISKGIQVRVEHKYISHLRFNSNRLRQELANTVKTWKRKNLDLLVITTLYQSPLRAEDLLENTPYCILGITLTSEDVLGDVNKTMASIQETIEQWDQDGIAVTPGEARNKQVMEALKKHVETQQEELAAKVQEGQAILKEALKKHVETQQEELATKVQEGQAILKSQQEEFAAKVQEGFVKLEKSLAVQETEIAELKQIMHRLLALLEPK
jgi:DNA polymerase III alpha subunit (gram-positive type)